MADIVAARLRILVTTDAKRATSDMGKLDGAIRKTGQSASASTSIFNKLSSSFGPAGMLGAIGLSIAGIGILASNLVSAASDAEETKNKFDITFSSIADEANKAAQDIAKGFGLAQQEAQKFLSNTGDLLSGFGFTQKASLDLSKSVQELAADLASFTNIEGGVERASQALTSALFGEREAVKSLGIVITEQDIKSRLAAKGLSGLTGQALLQAKAQATLEIATEQSKNAIGDFARSQTSFANQSRSFLSLIKDMAVIIGEPLKNSLNEVLTAILQNRNSFQEYASIIAKVVQIFGKIISLGLQFISTVLRQIVGGTEDGADAFALLDDALTSTIAALEELRPAIEFVAEIIGTFIQLIIDLVVAIKEEFGPALSDAAKTIKNFGSDLIDVIDELRGIETVYETVEVLEDTSKASEKASKSIDKLSQSAGKGADALKILAEKGDVSAQLQLIKRQYAEQANIVKSAGLNTAALDVFYQKKRESQVAEYLNNVKEMYSGSVPDQIRAVEAAYSELLASDKLSYDERLAVQSAYIEASKQLERDRINAINEQVQLFGGISQQIVDFGQFVVDSRNKQTELELQDMQRLIEQRRKQGASEEELAALQEKIDKKRRKMERQQAKEAKIFAIFTAIINTALAVTNALASMPPPASFIVAGITAAFGAAQVAIIAAEKLPSAQFGGQFMVPPGNEADTGLVRVNQGETVTVTPARQTGEQTAAGGGFPKQVKLVVDGREFTAYLTEQMNTILNSGKVKITRKGVA